MVANAHNAIHGGHNAASGAAHRGDEGTYSRKPAQPLPRPARRDHARREGVSIRELTDMRGSTTSRDSGGCRSSISSWRGSTTRRAYTRAAAPAQRPELPHQHHTLPPHTRLALLLTPAAEDGGLPRPPHCRRHTHHYPRLARRGHTGGMRAALDGRGDAAREQRRSQDHDTAEGDTHRPTTNKRPSDDRPHTEIFPPT